MSIIRVGLRATTDVQSSPKVAGALKQEKQPDRLMPIS
jgi:hypothetical protein